MSKSHESRLKSRQEMKEHRKRKATEGFEYELTATSLAMEEPQIARVRRITLTDQASIDQIPTDLQQIVNDSLDYIEQDQKKLLAQGGASTDTLKDRARNSTRFLPGADAFCLATFVDPVLFVSEEEADAFERSQKPDDTRRVWTLDLVEVEDRLDWFWACLDADHQAAKKLKLFRDRSAIDVPSRTVGNDDRQTAPQTFETPQSEEPRPMSLLQSGPSTV